MSKYVKRILNEDNKNILTFFRCIVKWFDIRKHVIVSEDDDVVLCFNADQFIAAAKFSNKNDCSDTKYLIVLKDYNEPFIVNHGQYISILKQLSML